MRRRSMGRGTTWQCRKCVEIVGFYMFNGRSSLCALQQCVACGQLGQEKSNEVREGAGEVHVKAADRGTHNCLGQTFV